MASVLDEFLVKLGFQIDKDGEAKFRASTAAVGKSVQKIGAVAAGAALAVGAAMLKAATDMNSVAVMSERTGNSVSKVSALAYAFKNVGANGEEAAAAVDALWRRLQSQPALAKSFRSIYKVEAWDYERNKLRDQSEIIKDLANRWRGMVESGNQMEAATARAEANSLGMSHIFDHMIHPDFVKSIDEASKRMADMGMDLDKNAETARRITKEWTKLKDIADKAFTGAALDLAESLGLAEGLASASDLIQNNFRSVSGYIRDGIKFLGDLKKKVTDFFSGSLDQKIRKFFSGWGSAPDEDPTGSNAGTGGAVDQQPDAAPEALTPVAPAATPADSDDGLDNSDLVKAMTRPKLLKQAEEAKKDAVRKADEARKDPGLASRIDALADKTPGEIARMADAAARASKKASRNTARSVDAVRKESAALSAKSGRAIADAQAQTASVAKEATRAIADAQAQTASVAKEATRTIAAAVSKTAEAGELGTGSAPTSQPDSAAPVRTVPTTGLRKDRLGWVSEANESRGNDAAINYKDLSGFHSYGRWQIYGGGTMQKYLPFMAKMGGEFAQIAERLGKFRINSAEFDRQWKLEAKRNPYALERSQYEFLKATHYDPVLKSFSKPLQEAIGKNRSLQEELWQAVVLGPGAAKGLFNRGWKEGGGDVETLIRVIYRDMHKYQRKYIAENPEHLPVLLKAHLRSLERVLSILRDPEKNKPLPENAVRVPEQQTGRSELSEVARSIDKLRNQPSRETKPRAGTGTPVPRDPEKNKPLSEKTARAPQQQVEQSELAKVARSIDRLRNQPPREAKPRTEPGNPVPRVPEAVSTLPKIARQVSQNIRNFAQTATVNIHINSMNAPSEIKDAVRDGVSEAFGNTRYAYNEYALS